MQMSHLKVELQCTTGDRLFILLRTGNDECPILECHRYELLLMVETDGVEGSDGGRK